MSTSLLYRIASVILVLFAAGHTIGFRQVQPEWKVDALVAGMRSSQFAVQGFTRSYWDFYVGFGLFVTFFLVFAAVLAWQLAGLPRAQLHEMALLTWSFALCSVGIAALSWRYFFAAPAAFSTVLAACLILGAAAASRPAS
jgi:hypothetical protein